MGKRLARLRVVRGRLKPIGLLLAGVYLLAGCLPVPSTQQYLVNGKAKPSYLIGRQKTDPVRLGETRIEDALDAVCERIAGLQAGETMLEGKGLPVSAAQIRRHVVVTQSGRRYVVPYARRSGYLIWPICFQAWTLSERDYLALDTDQRGVVIGYKTAHTPEVLGVRADEFGTFYYEPQPATRPKIPATTRTAP